MIRSEWALEARKLGKSFGKTEVLRGIDLTVPRGAVYGLLGPNGAGKKTLVNVFATLTFRAYGRRAK